MPTDVSRVVTSRLDAACRGDREAASQLLPLLYDQLRKLAQARMRSLANGQTLQPTALVHEAYARLVDKGDPGWDGRGHFYASAAQAMRDVLVEQVRRRMSLKRGGDHRRQELDELDVAVQPPKVELLALDEALRELEADDPRKGQIVNLRFFAGMSVPETAEVLGVSVSTIEREWRYIRPWLCKQLQGAPTRDG